MPGTWKRGDSWCVEFICTWVTPSFFFFNIKKNHKEGFRRFHTLRYMKGKKLAPTWAECFLI
jgi:hypothetical protein